VAAGDPPGTVKACVPEALQLERVQMRAAGCGELAAGCLNTTPWLASLRVLNLSLNHLGTAGSGALGAFLADAQVRGIHERGPLTELSLLSSPLTSPADPS